MSNAPGQEFKARSLSSPYHIMWLLYFVKGIDGLDVFNGNHHDYGQPFNTTNDTAALWTDPLPYK